MEGRGVRDTEPREGKMSETLGSGNISTKLARIAELVRKYPNQPLSSLHQCIDEEWLRESYRRTRKNAAVGVDGQTAEDYAQDLGGNLANLLERFRSGAYRAPAVRRVHIAKDDGRTRPIGIPTFEDKILQRAVAMVLEAVYEPKFYSGSYGFRPGRSAHDALESLWQSAMSIGGGWMLEVDIQSFFDTLDQASCAASSTSG